MPIRELPRTENSRRLNEHLSFERDYNPAQAPTVPSHDSLPSPVHFEHTCVSDIDTSARSPSHSHLSSSLDALESPINDHMDWAPPSPILSTPTYPTPLPAAPTLTYQPQPNTPSSSPTSFPSQHHPPVTLHTPTSKQCPTESFTTK